MPPHWRAGFLFIVSMVVRTRSWRADCRERRAVVAGLQTPLRGRRHAGTDRDAGTRPLASGTRPA